MNQAVAGRYLSIWRLPHVLLSSIFQFFIYLVSIMTSNIFPVVPHQEIWKLIATPGKGFTANLYTASSIPLFYSAILHFPSTTPTQTNSCWSSNWFSQNNSFSVFLKFCGALLHKKKPQDRYRKLGHPIFLQSYWQAARYILPSIIYIVAQEIIRLKKLYEDSSSPCINWQLVSCSLETKCNEYLA